MTPLASPGVRRREPLPLRTLGLVAVGAAAGALARHGVTLAYAGPVAIAIINVLGGLLLGLVNGRYAGHRADVVTLAGTGFCGGFTTFSTVMVGLAHSPAPALAAQVGLAGGQLVGAVLAAWVGVVLGGASTRSARSADRDESARAADEELP